MEFKLGKLLVACVLALALFGSGVVRAQSADGHPDWPGPGQLFVGTCYQPVDRSREQIERDIALMQKAGFKIVRMATCRGTTSSRLKDASISQPSTGSWIGCTPRASG
jgi:hypothetical protein